MLCNLATEIFGAPLKSCAWGEGPTGLTLIPTLLWSPSDSHSQLGPFALDKKVLALADGTFDNEVDFNDLSLLFFTQFWQATSWFLPFINKTEAGGLGCPSEDRRGCSLTLASDNSSMGCHGSPLVRNSCFSKVSVCSRKGSIWMFHFNKPGFSTSGESEAVPVISPGYPAVFPRTTFSHHDPMLTLSSHLLILKMCM